MDIDQGRIVKEITTGDLESACRKCMHLTVSDMRSLIRVMDEKKIEYAVTSDQEADVYGDWIFQRI